MAHRADKNEQEFEWLKAIKIEIPLHKEFRSENLPLISKMRDLQSVRGLVYHPDSLVSIFVLQTSHGFFAMKRNIDNGKYEKVPKVFSSEEACRKAIENWVVCWDFDKERVKEPETPMFVMEQTPRGKRLSVANYDEAMYYRSRFKEYAYGRNVF